ncbi:nicotinamide riboside kinase 1 isoform X4 [Microcebus murinus]|uniref:nicotinamide riboside kinase 1 isoform X4 n=1 Tax=Microcebus murinus TaxID=30608 RepID=UPI0006433C7E|nr:nicotinamide riboside kinase 1 isoform X2 [Microcebus murinus]
MDFCSMMRLEVQDQIICRVGSSRGLSWRLRPILSPGCCWSAAVLVLEALNMEKMMSAISCCMENPRHSLVSTDWGNAEETPILIIEGFLLFNYKPFATIWNRSYFLTIPYEECKRRRSTRVYNPPDPPGYLDGHVWPMYLKHRKEMEENVTWEIVYLDGTKSEDDLFSQVYEDIIQELEKQKRLQVTS